MSENTIQIDETPESLSIQLGFTPSRICQVQLGVENAHLSFSSISNFQSPRARYRVGSANEVQFGAITQKWVGISLRDFTIFNTKPP